MGAQEAEALDIEIDGNTREITLKPLFAALVISRPQNVTDQALSGFATGEPGEAEPWCDLAIDGGLPVVADSEIGKEEDIAISPAIGVLKGDDCTFAVAQLVVSRAQELEVFAMPLQQPLLRKDGRERRHPHAYKACRNRSEHHESLLGVDAG
ncbi:hypothetical protein [Maricaulis sp.]|uniref:hypothetical protein n=1 Tax=Maricaulis sp. TaxID=1486257 RepID=UPI00262B68F6|nr:hypothetical protein [Maricaulis sp.]